MSDGDLVALGAAALALGCAARPSATTRTAQSAKAAPAVATLPALTPDITRHVLGRFSYGPTLTDPAWLASLGVERWFEEQLVPPPPGEAATLAAAPYRRALGQPDDVVAAFAADERSDPVDTEHISLRKQANRINVKELVAAVGAAQTARQVTSDAQLQALMIDFWANHFNVYLRKNAVKVLGGNYVETAIVPHALGRFEDLLVATARHPAMLIYLDNDKSVVADKERELSTGRLRGGANPKPRKKRGLNENYARELLELHTLGVDGGYTQQDVIEVARVLTGFGLCRPEDGLSYEFRPDRHDRGSKTVLGVAFGPNGGEEEGLALLRMLAKHPATAQHIAGKLCRRFVSDAPDAPCVARVAARFRETDGDIAATLRAILHDPSFWDPTVRGGKLKKPSEFLASALRALGAELDASTEITKVSQQLGEPPLLQPVPTGYADIAAAWSGGAQLLARMDVATRLVSGKVPGVKLPNLDELWPSTLALPELVARINRVFFLGLGDARTLQVVREEAGAIEEPVDRRNAALALALGSPAFQRR
jgi:uncharacterized protein (DUF1800 family)